jgi:hypothetical protein
MAGELLTEAKSQFGNEALKVIGGNERAFWNYVQDECVAYLENQGEISRQGSLDFIGTMGRRVGEGKHMVPPQVLNDFDTLHDIIFFYGNAGVDPKALTAIIKTSSGAHAAKERVLASIQLNHEDVKHAIENTKNFNFRDFKTILKIVEEHGMLRELLIKLDQTKISQIISSSMREYDVGEENAGIFPEDAHPGEEVKTLELLEILRKYLGVISPTSPEENTRLNESYRATGQGINVIEFRVKLIKFIHDGSPARQKFFAEKLWEMKINTYAISVDAFYELKHTLDDMSKQYSRIEKWFSNTNELTSEDKLLFDKWMILSEEGRKNFEQV